MTASISTRNITKKRTKHFIQYVLIASFQKKKKKFDAIKIVEIITVKLVFFVKNVSVNLRDQRASRSWQS